MYPEPRDNQDMTETARACLARLREMDSALEHMERELPDDVRPIGAAARKRVANCVSRLTVEGVQPDELTEALRDVSQMMDALTARLLFVPWDPPGTQLKS